MIAAKTTAEEVMPAEGSGAAPIGLPPMVVVESAVSTGIFYAQGIAISLRMLVVVPCIMMAIFVAAAVTRRRGFGPSFRIMVSFQLVLIGLVLGRLILKYRSDWRKDCAAHRGAADVARQDDPSWIVKEALLEVGGLCRLKWWNNLPDPRWRNRFQGILRARGLPQNIVILQKETGDGVRAIAVDERFVEPERLLGEIPPCACSGSAGCIRIRGRTWCDEAEPSPTRQHGCWTHGTIPG